MALKSNFNSNRSMRDIEKQAERLYEKILNSFIYSGEEFVGNARSQMQDHAMGTYKDVTTNLRSSIQYFVFHNGELVKAGESDFSASNRSAIQDFINPKGFQLIGIAGMNYASHVETKGYNVISYQADICLLDLTGYLENIGIVKEGAAARTEETFIP